MRFSPIGMQTRASRLLSTPWLGVALILGGLACDASATDAAPSDAVEAVTQAQPAVVPAEFNGDLRKLTLAPFAAGEAPLYRPLLRPPRATSKAPLPGAVEPSVRSLAGVPLAPMPSPSQNFAGMSFADICGGPSCGAGWPPDTNGDVGPNHYIQAVNSSYAIYNKTGTRLAAFRENQLWAGTGQPQCDGHGQGDPVVLYDRISDRWILTHFAFSFSGPNPISPFYQCIAASKTSDPVNGGWWLYAVRMDPGGGAGVPPAGTLNDYGKFGLWHDCLYMASNGFDFAPPIPPTGPPYTGVAVASFSRSDLYRGAPLTYSLGYLTASFSPPVFVPFTLIPSNNVGTGVNAVLPGTPNYFVSESGLIFAFEVRKFTAGTNCGAGGTLSALTNVSQVAYSYSDLGNTAVEVPQPGTTNHLDSIDDRLMQKVQYRRDPIPNAFAETLWVTHNVDPCTNAPCSTHGPTAMQWAQLNVTGGTIQATPLQEQIYTPDATLYRWMGSLAVDSQGNMALGYSTSNGSAPNYPSIAYSGRLVFDPPNMLPQTEAQLVAGAGSQTNACGGAPCNRWGDYSAMTVDPVDGCTFWYTSQYYSSLANGTAGNWQTRIGSFKFPSCITPTTRVLVPDGTSEQQAFTSPIDTKWFVVNVEPGKTYVIEAVDPTDDMTANAVSALDVFGPDGHSAPPEASVDCTLANGPRPPAVDVASDGIRCVLRTAPPIAGSQQNKRPVYIRVMRVMLNEALQFKIRVREATIYGRWLTMGYDYHVEVENTTGDAMCVEVARYPASGLTYTAGPGWSGSIASFTLTVPPFGAVKQVIASGSLVGADSEGALRLSACAAPTNLLPAGLHVSTYAFDPVGNRYVYFFTATANEGKTRSTWQ